MRVIQLSGKDPDFRTPQTTQEYFKVTLWEREQPGKFCVTKQSLRYGGIRDREQIVFLRRKRAVCLALAASELRRNEDGERSSYPKFFMLDRRTLQVVDVDWEEAQREYKLAARVDRNLMKRGWFELQDSVYTEELWARLGGAVNEVDTARGEYVPTGADGRKRRLRSVCERPGQGKFRDEMRKRFDGRCAITRCDVFAVLEAAHVSPYLGDADDDRQNGLLLRADVHALFDCGLLRINPETLAIEMDPKVGAAYEGMIPDKLELPKKLVPSKEALRERYKRSGEVASGVTG